MDCEYVVGLRGGERGRGGEEGEGVYNWRHMPQGEAGGC